MRTARPGEQVIFSINGVPPGDAAGLGFRLRRVSDDVDVLARTTAGIAEDPVGSWAYEITISAPAPGVYDAVWDTGGVFFFDDEQLDVGLASRTFLDLQDEALGDDFDATKYRARVKTWMNEGLSRIARNMTVPGLEATAAVTTVAGQSAYSLPADDVRVTSLREPSRRETLEAVGIQEIDEARTASGRPANYAVFADQLVLYPIPDGVYALELRYLKGATALLNDADTPSLPPEYVDLLVTYARYKLYRAEDDPEMANYYQGEWQRELGLMKSDVQHTDRGRVRRVAGMWS